MLDALHAAGVRRSVLVVGHCADQVRAEAARAPEGMAIEFVHNPDYAKGSALSLYAARDVLRGPRSSWTPTSCSRASFSSASLRSPEPNAFLIDEEFQDTGEEVKIYVQAGRVIALGKKVVPEAWDLVGEGIGFLKCGPEAGRALVALLEQVIAESDGALGVRGRPAPARRPAAGGRAPRSGGCRGPRWTSRWTSSGPAPTSSRASRGWTT